MKRAYADIPEGQIHYRIEGEGDPILLLHMAVGSSDEFSRVMHYLSKTYCTIAPDFLGAGDSDPTPYEYKVIDDVNTLRCFMDTIGIKKASLVGHFHGAKIAAEFGVNWPERVDKLILAGTGFSEDEVNEPPDFVKRVEIQRDGSHLKEWWRRACLWGEYPLDILEERVLEYIKAGPRGEEAHWSDAYYDFKSRLPLISCPTLVIDSPGYFSHHQAETVRGLIPDCKLTTIENGPMYLDRAMPKEFAEAIINFLG